MIVSDTIWQPDLSKAGRSKYKALAQAIRDGIASGQLAIGSKLPPVRDLAYRLGITPGTVARAYTVLTDEGLLTAGVGRGTFVADVTPPQPKRPDGWTPTTLIESTQSDPTEIHLLSPKMPDMGQVALLREAMAHVADTIDPLHLLQYPSRETDITARNVFVSELEQDHTGPSTADDVVVTYGGQNAIMMILQTLLTGPSPVVAVDALSYGGFRSASLMNRAEVVGVPGDAEGPDVATLENLIKTRDVQVFCTSAEVCNPTVACTSVTRREEIARLATRYGVHIVDDDCYRLARTRYRGPSYRALCPDLGWYVTSPSKSITPALRIGFAMAPNGWSSQLVRNATFNSFGVTRLITDVYAALMQRPEIPQVIDAVRDRIAQDVRAAVNILGRYALNWSEDVPFFWLELPEGWRAGEFCQAADGAGVLLKSAEEFALRDSRSTHAVRIAINGQIHPDAFVAAMRNLRDLLDNPPGRISV